MNTAENRLFTFITLATENEDNVTIEWIPQVNWTDFERKIAALNKKNTKFKLPLLKAEIIGKKVELDKRKKKKIPYAQIKITGKKIVVDGWLFVAKLERTLGGPAVIIKSIGGESIPDSFRNPETQDKCDACGYKRRRNDTYVLRNTKNNTEYKQVGSDCLKDFLHGHDPAKILSLASILQDALKEAQDEESLGSSSGIAYDDLESYLATVAAAARTFGYKSVKQAKEENEKSGHEYDPRILVAEASADIAITERFPPRGYSHRFSVTEADQETAKKAIAIIKDNLGPKKNRSDYEHNIYELAQQEIFDVRKHARFVASIMGYYLRESNKASTPGGNKPGFVGTPGQRSKFVLQLLRVLSFNNDYGVTFMNIFVDAQGNSVIWKGSTNIQSLGVTINEIVELEASLDKDTNKAHQMYKDTPTTYISRGKILAKHSSWPVFAQPAVKTSPIKQNKPQPVQTPTPVTTPNTLIAKLNENPDLSFVLTLEQIKILDKALEDSNVRAMVKKASIIINLLPKLSPRVVSIIAEAAKGKSVQVAILDQYPKMTGHILNNPNISLEAQQLFLSPGFQSKINHAERAAFTRSLASNINADSNVLAQLATSNNTVIAAIAAKTLKMKKG